VIRWILRLVRRREEHRQLWTETGQHVAHREAIVVAELDVQENAVRGVALDCVQRGRGGSGLGDDVIATRRQEHPGGLPERRMIVDYDDARRAADGRFWSHRAKN